MTRQHIKNPVWTWTCDRCGAGSGDLGLTQQSLPKPYEMRTRGWYIAPTFGDLCPACYAQEGTNE